MNDNRITLREKPRHVITFDDGQTRYEYWRIGWHSLRFVFGDGALTASVDNRHHVETRDAGMIERVRSVLQESRSDVSA